jgi:hypothetical protein
LIVGEIIELQLELPKSALELLTAGAIYIIICIDNDT